MWRKLVLIAALALLVAPGGRMEAANREHQQMLADIRMLQEQSQQLQLMLAALTEAVRAVGTKVDQQTEQNRRAFADQKLLVDNLSSEVRVLREKLDDTSVRLNSLSQEMDALRKAVAAMPTQTSSMAVPPEGASPTSPGGAPATPGAGEPTGGSTAAPTPAPTVPPVAAGTSPQRMYDSAYADYTSGQWALAIAGFESYLRTFPKTDMADNAQFFIGEAYSYDEKLKEAIAAYDKVIANYPSGDKVPDAYYKRGLALSLLGESNRARESFETVLKKYPKSDAAELARQVLEGMNRRSR